MCCCSVIDCVKSCALFLIIMLFSHVHGSNINDNAMTLLRKEKLLGYDSNSRPVKDHNHNTTVYLGISAIRIDINDYEQTMIMNTYLSLMWYDEFLHWNPNKFNNITKLHFDTNEVWVPDIALYNSAKGEDAVPKSTLPVLALSDGTVFWVPPYTAEVPCRLDLTHWPSDKHTCTMMFGSWAHHGELINLEINEYFDTTGLTFLHYKDSTQWEVLSYNSTRDETVYVSDAYHFIDFSITVQRKAADQAAFITQTTLALMLVVLSSYILPLSYHHCRLLLHMTALSLSILCNFVIYLSLPSTGGGIPFVVRYFSGTIILTTLSLICTVGLVTAMSAVGNNSQTGVKKKLVTLLGFSNAADNDRSQLGATNEVVYSNLEEELKDMSDNQQGDPSNRFYPTDTSRVAAKSIGRGIFHFLNVILFFTFSIAYIVDYFVLRSSIGK